MDNYIQVDTSPILHFSLSELVNSLGADTAKNMISDFRYRARAAYVGELMIAVCAPVSNEPGQEKFGRLCKEIGIYMLTTHAWYKSHEKKLTYEYNKYVEPTIERMKFVQKAWGLPLCPSVMVGKTTVPEPCSQKFLTLRGDTPTSPSR